MSTSVLQNIVTPLTQSYDISLYLKRDDQLDAEIIGNKWRKLLPHIEPVIAGGFQRVVTMGGAHSNHIVSTSYLTARHGIPTMAYVRGDELNANSNDVLRTSHTNGMDLRFISRRQYRELRQSESCHFIVSGPEDYWLPEGGMSTTSKDGCKDIVRELDVKPDWIFCACGTGTTISGIAEAAMSIQLSAKITGVCALLPSSMIRNNIANLCGSFPENLELEERYATRLGKAARSIIDIMKRYDDDLDVQLDFNYTGKMMACVEDYINEGIILPGQVVVAVHSGGQETAGLKHLS